MATLDPSDPSSVRFVNLDLDDRPLSGNAWVSGAEVRS
jgi:hypothetical protein